MYDRIEYAMIIDSQTPGLIKNTIDKSSAQKAGIQIKDRNVSVNHMRIHASLQLQEILQRENLATFFYRATIVKNCFQFSNKKKL